MRRPSGDSAADLRQLAWRGDTSLHGTFVGHSAASRPSQVEIERSALHQATASGKTSAVEALLIRGTSVDQRDEYGLTPLHIAAETGDLQMAQYLVSKRANINAQDCEGNTPLHVAARTRDIELANFLLYRGADLTLANSKGWTALHAAVNANDRDLAQALVLRGADPLHRDKQGISPYDWAQKLQHLDILDIFKQKLALATAGATPRLVVPPSELTPPPAPPAAPRPFRLPPTPFPGMPAAPPAAAPVIDIAPAPVAAPAPEVGTTFGVPQHLLVARVHDDLKVDGLVSLSRLRNYGGSSAVFRGWAGWRRHELQHGQLDALYTQGEGPIIVAGIEILCQARLASGEPTLAGALPGKGVLYLRSDGRLRIWVNGVPWCTLLLHRDAPAYRADFTVNPGDNLIVFAWEPSGDCATLHMHFEDKSPHPHAVLSFV
ncbi:MAG: ankyrin repeat domain-containing protein [Armatimonadota bacterium]